MSTSVRAPEPSTIDAMVTAIDSLSFRPAAETDMPFLLELRRRTMTDHQLASGVRYTEDEQRERVLARFECAQIILLSGEPVGRGSVLGIFRDLFRGQTPMRNSTCSS